MVLRVLLRGEKDGRWGKLFYGCRYSAKETEEKM